jgi:hypothetical protein
MWVVLPIKRLSLYTFYRTFISFLVLLFSLFMIDATLIFLFSFYLLRHESLSNYNEKKVFIHIFKKDTMLIEYGQYNKTKKLVK